MGSDDFLSGGPARAIPMQDRDKQMNHLYFELYVGLCRALAAPWLDPWLFMLDQQNRREVVRQPEIVSVTISQPDLIPPQERAQAAWGVTPRVINGDA